MVLGPKHSLGLCAAALVLTTAAAGSGAAVRWASAVAALRHRLATVEVRDMAGWVCSVLVFKKQLHRLVWSKQKA